MTWRDTHSRMWWVISSNVLAIGTSSLPDPVELIHVEGQQPARGDQPVADAVEPHGPPTPLTAGENRTALRDRGNVFAFPLEYLARAHRERSRGDLASPGEVGHHVIDALVSTRDRIPARNGPDDLLAEKRAQRALGA